MLRRRFDQDASNQYTSSSASMRVRNVILEDMGFSAQIQAFSQARIVVGQYGAGLSHILFLKPSSLVIEICARLDTTYAALATHRRLVYEHVSAGCSNPAEPHSRVDIDSVVTAVETYLDGGYHWEGAEI